MADKETIARCKLTMARAMLTGDKSFYGVLCPICNNGEYIFLTNEEAEGKMCLHYPKNILEIAREGVAE